MLSIQAIKQPNVPLPRSLFYFSCASTVVAFVLLPICLLDLGILSLYMNPPMAIFTLLYHGFVLVVSQRPRKPNHPTYYASAILFAFLLDIAWLIAFICTMVVYASQTPGFYSIQNLSSKGLPVTVGTQRLQIILSLTLVILTGGMAVKGYLIARAEGEPDSWRPEGLSEYYFDDDEDLEKANESRPPTPPSKSP